MMIVSLSDEQTDRQTDRQTNSQADYHSYQSWRAVTTLVLCHVLRIRKTLVQM